MEKIIIDIEGAPPTQAEFDAYHKAVEIEKARQHRPKYLIYLLRPAWPFMLPAIIVVVSAINLSTQRVDPLANAWVYVGLFILSVVFAITGSSAMRAYNDHFNINQKYIDSIIKSLEPIGRDLLPEIVEWCKTDPTICAYQNAVVEQGRVLIVAEHLAMKHWIKVLQSNIADENKEKHAFDLLQHPIVFERKNKWLP